MRVLSMLVLSVALIGRAQAGSLVMVGGALEDERIVREIVRRAGGPGAKIGILTSSSGDPSGSGAFYVELFGKYGATPEWIPVDRDHKANNRDPELVGKIAGLGGVFFGGGDQSRYLDCLLEDGKDSPLLAAIRKRYVEGDLVLAGTSAGTAVMTKSRMITGGKSRDVYDKAIPSALHGLGFFTQGLLDTHFAQRKRQARIVRLASDHGVQWAFGVDENTALIVDDPLGKNPRMRVLGKNGVSMFRVKTPGTVGARGWSIKNVGVTYLGDGDRYHLGEKSLFLGVDTKRPKTIGFERRRPLAARVPGKPPGKMPAKSPGKMPGWRP